MYPDTYRFIAAVEYGSNGAIGIYFPDLPGCTSCTESKDKVIEHAREALSLHLYGMEEDGDEIPNPSELKDIKLESNEMPLVVEVDMKPFREKMRIKEANRGAI